MTEKKHHFATLRFDVPDKDGPTYKERAHLAPPGALYSVDERLELHDMRTSPDIVKGAAGLDVQGFTYLQHQSAIQKADQFLTGRNIEEIYIPELEALLCQFTGAKKAIVDSVMVRSKATEQGLYVPPKDVVLRGTPLGDMLAAMPREAVAVMGRESNEMFPPSRPAHVDCSIQGLREAVRYCRDNIRTAALPYIEAEDAGQPTRYAQYTMWRPLKTVRRDPLAVCDSRTLDKSKEVAEIDFAGLSNVTEDGEYLMHSLLGLPPQKPVKQKWYFLPEQQPDELVIVKFADTLSDRDPEVSSYGLHLSPKLDGQEEEQPRTSIEARVYAFF